MCLCLSRDWLGFPLSQTFPFPSDILGFVFEYQKAIKVDVVEDKRV